MSLGDIMLNQSPTTATGRFNFVHHHHCDLYWRPLLGFFFDCFISQGFFQEWKISWFTPVWVPVMNTVFHLPSHEVRQLIVITQPHHALMCHIRWHSLAIIAWLLKSDKSRTWYSIQDFHNIAVAGLDQNWNQKYDLKKTKFQTKGDLFSNLQQQQKMKMKWKN